MHKYPQMKGPARPVWVAIAIHGGTPTDHETDVKVTGVFPGPDAANVAARGALGERCHRSFVVCADGNFDLLPSRAFRPHSGAALPTQDEIAFLARPQIIDKVETVAHAYRAYLSLLG